MKIHVVFASLLAALSAAAVEIGQPYDRLVEEIGLPAGRIERNGVVFLNYTDRTIVLRDGRVVEVKAPPRQTSAVTITIGEPGEWLTDPVAAMALAKQERRYVMLVFTNPEESPASKALERELLANKEFGEVARERLVLVWADFSPSAALSAQQQRLNQELARHHRVTAYPTLIVMGPDGTLFVRTQYEKGAARSLLQRLKSL